MNYGVEDFDCAPGGDSPLIDDRDFGTKPQREKPPKREVGDEGRRVLDRNAPLDVARSLVIDRHTDDAGHRLAHHLRGDWLLWTGSAYAAAEPAAMRAELYRYLDGCDRLEHRGARDDRQPTAVPFRPRQRDVDNVLDALRAECHAEAAVPAWINPTPTDPNPRRLIVARNGWCDPAEDKLALRPPDPRLLATAALDFDVDPNAPPPTAWLAFLDSLGLKLDEALLLREWFGYCLTADTSQQKALMLVGPRRSGKGTILRVLTSLVGTANTASPALGSLANNFGIAPLLNARLATVTDARLSGRTDTAVVVERLLSIIGEDALTVDRKHREPVTVKLDARFTLATNELPRLADSSGALSGRMLILPLTRSYYGKEDTGLTRRLMAELPGVLLWALEGLRSLRQRGRFVQPHRGDEMQQEMDDLASPVGAFIRECCEVGPGLEVPCGELFAKWREWCHEQGRDRPGTSQTLGRDLRAVEPGIGISRRRTDFGRSRYYEGITVSGGAD